MITLKIDSVEDLKYHLCKIDYGVNKEIPKLPGVYFLFDELNEMFYVGETKDLRQRISVHNSQTKPYNCKFIIIKEKSRRYRKGLEGIYIEYYKPTSMDLDTYEMYY